jgi:transcription initiation factor TFIIIB Brf1 subunit/transcription initiation factor TFIIB
METTGSECDHKNVMMEGSQKTCEDCGVILNKEDVIFEKEWRYYGMMDTKHTQDPNRCHARRNEEKMIFKDVEKLGFSDRIIMIANEIYEQVTKGRIYRANSRKGIIFACIFHAYKVSGSPQSCEQLIEIFGMDRKIGLKGLKFVNLNAPKDAEFRQFQISTDDLIGEIMDKFHATPVQKEEVLDIYHRIRDKSSLMNRSRPQSVACGIVKYYINQKNKDISMEFFQSRVGLSEITIQRLVNEIDRLLNTNDPQPFETLETLETFQTSTKEMVDRIKVTST